MIGDGDDGDGHVKIQFSPLAAICEAREFTIEYSREELDVTTLPCGVGASAGSRKWAADKKYQPGYADINGTMTVYLTSNDIAISNRLLESIHRNDQHGLRAKLYVDAVSDGAATPMPDDSASRFVAGDMTLTSMSTGVNPDDPTQAEISFRLFNLTHWISVDTTT